MENWNIIGIGSGGEVESKAFGVTLDISHAEWTVGGVSSDKFFATKNGHFIGTGDGLLLRSFGDGAEVALFSGMTVDSEVGANGTGQAFEKQAAFSWVLESKS